MIKYLIYTILGKSIQNARDHINIEFAKTEKKMNEIAVQKNYLNHKIISENCVAVASRPACVRLDKAFAIGFTSNY